MSHNFVYGRPVHPSEFLDRESELQTVFNRIRNGECTAIVGEPHIGKTSLLLKLLHPTTQQAFVGKEAQSLIFNLIDLHPIADDYATETFWKEILAPLAEHPGHKSISRRLEQVLESGYKRRPLLNLFRKLAERDYKLVILLDEFERLLTHPKFQSQSFFALLRSLATHTGGLVIVTASRLSVAQMNERGRQQLYAGSPFFNHFIEVQPRLFDEKTISDLLNQDSKGFAQDEYHFIRRLAGRHPFLLQAAAATWLETDPNCQDRPEICAERFYERISAHFDDLWETLNDSMRTTAVILSLVELGGRAVGQDFAFGEIEDVDAFGPELRRLAKCGLAERVSTGWDFDWTNLLLWRGERWTVGTQAFIWWIHDAVIAETRKLKTYDEWLNAKRYKLILTQELWDSLLSRVKDLPEWAVRGLGALARSLFEELKDRR